MHGKIRRTKIFTHKNQKKKPGFHHNFDGRLDRKMERNKMKSYTKILRFKFFLAKKAKS